MTHRPTPRLCHLLPTLSMLLCASHSLAVGRNNIATAKATRIAAQASSFGTVYTYVLHCRTQTGPNSFTDGQPLDSSYVYGVWNYVVFGGQQSKSGKIIPNPNSAIAGMAPALPLEPVPGGMQGDSWTWAKTLDEINLRMPIGVYDADFLSPTKTLTFMHEAFIPSGNPYFTNFSSVVTLGSKGGTVKFSSGGSTNYTTEIGFQIVDISSGEVVYRSFHPVTTTSVIVPSGVLTKGRKYLGFLLNIADLENQIHWDESQTNTYLLINSAN